MPARDWTLLVQGVNLHVAAADALLRRFAFIPYARLDDLMVSYAAPGGGVGPHVDSYDVFLLQGEGRRRWRDQPPARSVALKPGTAAQDPRALPAASDEWTLEPGDMLYLPPELRARRRRDRRLHDVFDRVSRAIGAGARDGLPRLAARPSRARRPLRRPGRSRLGANRRASARPCNGVCAQMLARIRWSDRCRRAGFSAAT